MVGVFELQFGGAMRGAYSGQEYGTALTLYSNVSRFFGAKKY